MILDKLDNLIREQTQFKLAHIVGFNPNDTRLLKLAKLLNSQYSPDLPWDPTLIAGKIYELEQQSGNKITEELIFKSLQNYFAQNIPYQKDLEYFIISKKEIDGVEEYNSDLLTFSEL